MFDFKTNSWEQLTDHFGIDTEPDWSPNGKKIIFTSNRSGSPQIYEMTVSNRKIRRKTFEGSYNARARYTPDGRSIVFVHRREGLFHVATQDLKTGRIKILTDTYLDESPTISPNGNIIIYATKNKEENILAGISIDGKTKFIYRICVDPGGMVPDWIVEQAYLHFCQYTVIDLEKWALEN